MKLIPIKEQLPPLDYRVLLYWKDSRHFEDGRLFEQEDEQGVYHVLFDGEMLNSEPTHWAYIDFE